MFRSADNIIGFSVAATDGEIGKVDDIYFDDSFWITRYLVVDLGNWLVGRQVLISTQALGPTGISTIAVHLTMEQIENGPGLEAGKPVTRRHEEALHRYYGWPYYWDYDTTRHPAQSRSNREPRMRDAPETEEEYKGDTSGAEGSLFHLKSFRDTRGYHLRARESEAGRVADMIIDDEGWTIPYLVVDVGGRFPFPGRQTLVYSHWVERIDWEAQQVVIPFTREKVRSGPPFDHTRPLGRELEHAVFDHYDQRPYWVT